MNPIVKSTVLAITLSASVVAGYGQGNTQPGTTQGGAAGTTQGTNPCTNRGGAGTNTPNSANPQTTPPNGNTQGTTPNTSGNRQSTTQSTTSTQNANTSDGDAAMQLVEINNAEVALGRTASTKAQNAAVKSFAEMMVKDHTAALTKLRDVQGVGSTDMKPNSKHQATADRLSKLSGAEFDREYISAMVSGHQEALEFLEKHSRTTTSNTTSNTTSAGTAGKMSLAKISEEMIPTVREHLQQAQKIQRDLGGNANSGSTTSSTNSTNNRNNTNGTNSTNSTNSTSGTNNTNNTNSTNTNRSNGGTPAAPAGGNR